MTDVAFLVYTGHHKKHKRKSKTFDGWSNVGAYVVKDVLERAGISVGWTSADAAHLYRVILISLTSLTDVYNLIESVSHLSAWKKNARKFVVIAGGFGLQNVYPLEEYVDFAGFGRAEVFIVDLVESLLSRNDFQHESVMPLRDEIRPVKLAQAERLYPYPVKVGDFVFNEEVLGCPLKCAFCHYTHARKWIGGDPANYVRNGQYAASAQGLFTQSADLVDPDNPQRRIITGLDGFSERIRYAVGKRISNETLITVLESAAARGLDLVRYKLYMIAGYPGETEADRTEFIETMRRVRAIRSRLIVVVHVTPFRSMPLSPSAWLPVDVEHDWRHLGNTSIYSSEHFKAWFDLYIDSPLSLLMDMIIARATPDSNDLVIELSTNNRIRRLHSSAALETIAKKWDITSYVKRFALDEVMPTWYLSSYQPDGSLLRAARHLCQSMMG